MAGGVNIEFFQEKYSSRIKFYYLRPEDRGFCQRIIDFFYLNKDSLNEADLDLVRAGRSRRIKVYRVKFKEKDCYLKVYTYKRISKKIQNNLLRRPEGIRNLKMALSLLAAGIPTARPVCLGTRRNLLTCDSIFFMEKADGIELEEYVKTYELTGNHDVLRALGSLWGKMIKNRFIHQDPGLDNVFIDFNKGIVQIMLIDLDDIYLLPFLPMKLGLHSVARFLAKTYICQILNRKKPLTRADLDLFLQELINNCHKAVHLPKFTAALERLIIKKIYERKKQSIIPYSPVLSDIVLKSQARRFSL